MGLSADPQAFGPVADKADPRAAGTGAGSGGNSSHASPLAPLIAALGRAVERATKNPQDDIGPDASRRDRNA